MGSENTVNLQLARLEHEVDWLKRAVHNLQLCRRQALLSEVGHLEKALGIRPTTAELRRQAKHAGAGVWEEQPSAEEAAECGSEEAQAAEGGEGC